MSDTKSRPILFSGPMVQAILEGRKTQTRRVVKPQPSDYSSSEMATKCIAHACPFGVPGDRLWVRETFIKGHKTDESGYLITLDENGDDIEETVWYRADRDLDSWLDEDGYLAENIPWKPSIHMPRWASRITLEVKRVWVERVQEISASDVLDEGTAGVPVVDIDINGDWYPDRLAPAFKSLWNSINTKPGHTWDDNPWVWCVEFERVEETR